MKKTNIFLFFFFCVSPFLFAQSVSTDSTETTPITIENGPVASADTPDTETQNVSENPPATDLRKMAFTIGAFNAAGIVGMDLEAMITEQIGLQLGCGMGFVGLGFDAGLNVHFKRNNIRSSFINIGYCHYGVGKYHTVGYLGPRYVFRAKKLFTFSAGFAVVTDIGPNVGPDANVAVGNMVLTGTIGLYFPF